MKKTPSLGDTISIVILSICIPATIFGFSILSSGERNLGVVENIYGIPYPTHDGSTVILEDMAHTDLFLQESVLGKNLKLSLSFDPQDADSISLGVRQDSFWLSYKNTPLYQKGIDAPGFQTKEITIPITQAIQDTNRSIDLMFFTEDSSRGVEWRIYAFHASVEPSMVTFPELRSYIKSVITRERPL